MQDGPAILVGHSYGGAVITEAGRHPRVTALVYITAFAPDAGPRHDKNHWSCPAELAVAVGAPKKMRTPPSPEWRVMLGGENAMRSAATTPRSFAPLVFAHRRGHAASDGLDGGHAPAGIALAGDLGGA